MKWVFKVCIIEHIKASIIYFLSMQITAAYVFVDMVLKQNENNKKVLLLATNKVFVSTQVNFITAFLFQQTPWPIILLYSFQLCLAFKSMST